jgi:hypothetical protein
MQPPPGLTCSHVSVGVVVVGAAVVVVAATVAVVAGAAVVTVVVTVVVAVGATVVVDGAVLEVLLPPHAESAAETTMAMTSGRGRLIVRTIRHDRTPSR